MQQEFNGYTDAFAGTLGNAGSATTVEPKVNKLVRQIHKLRRRNKELKRALKEQRAVEKERAAEEQRAAEDAKKKEKTLWQKIGTAIEKAAPKIIMGVVTFFIKSFFSRKYNAKYKCA